MAELVLIIGVTGYIGFQTLLRALQDGYTVRAVVRKSEQIPKLTSHPAIAPFTSFLSFIVVPDMAVEGAFDAAVKDVTAIIHLASPLAIETDDYDRDIISPAIAINSSVLNSALRIPTIRRVIITSSAVTLIPFQALSSPVLSEKLHTSNDINHSPTRPFSSAMEAYWASKALARVSVRDFCGKNKPHFEYIQLLPSVVIGADPRATSPESLLEGTRALVLGPLLGMTAPYPMVGVPVHVKDVAKAHVDAIKPSVEGNKDYILSSDTPEGVEWDDALGIAEKYFKGDVEDGKVLKMGGSLKTTKWLLDGKSAEEAFGWKFTGFEETMKGLIGQFVELSKESAM